MEKHEHPERPLECAECKREITVHYKEIAGGETTSTGMCEVCPQLQKKLRGTPKELALSSSKKQAGLACGECGTTLDAIRVGNPVGCSVCYEVFGDVILSDLLTAKKISPAIAKKKKNVPLHIGRTPGETQELSPSLQLIALNEALTETLKKEDYEQAAWLRDQIKAITEEPEDAHNDES